MELRTVISPTFSLRDPFIIASSHWTANENAFKQFRTFEPSGVTLKTTSQAKGGDGSRSLEQRRKSALEDSYGNNFAFFTDGPKTLELIDIPATYHLTQIAKEVLPKTAIGLSVLQGEDYAEIASGLKLDLYEYVELNMKYSFRSLPSDQLTEFVKAFTADVQKFISAFQSRPLIVKFSREATPLLRLGALADLLATIADVEGAILVANSLRTARASVAYWREAACRIKPGRGYR